LKCFFGAFFVAILCNFLKSIWRFFPNSLGLFFVKFSVCLFSGIFEFAEFSFSRFFRDLFAFFRQYFFCKSAKFFAKISPISILYIFLKNMKPNIFHFVRILLSDLYFLNALSFDLVNQQDAGRLAHFCLQILKSILGALKN
jgi:hypothetical protein